MHVHRRAGVVMHRHLIFSHERGDTTSAVGGAHGYQYASGSDERLSLQPLTLIRVATSLTAELKKQQQDRAAEPPETELLRKLVRGGKIDTKTINALITLVASRGAQDAEFARLVMSEFEKSYEGGIELRKVDSICWRFSTQRVWG